MVNSTQIVGFCDQKELQKAQIIISDRSTNNVLEQF